MQSGKVALQFMAITCILTLSACALWFVPQSRNRGHIFDEASRGVTHFDLQDVQQRLYQGLQRAYPPGTPLVDVTGHIEAAGGICSSSDPRWAKPDFETTICTFENDIYFAEPLFFMGEPTFWLTHNDWTVFVAHSQSAVGWYVVEGQATQTQLSREDYMDGLDRQRTEEDSLRTNARR